MNDSPTNNPLKYSQVVNAKSIPVPADTSGGPASTTGALLGPPEVSAGTRIDLTFTA